MPRPDHRRRLAVLELAIVPAGIRAVVDRIAAEDDLTPAECDELMAGARDLAAACRPGATLEEIAAYVTVRDGLTPDEHDELIARTRRRLEEVTA